MCGIVGLYLKNPKLQPRLGAMFKPMLLEMTSRGPDSAGVAIYRNPVKQGQVKFSLAHDDPKFDWESVGTCLEEALECEAAISRIANHAILTADAREADVTAWLKRNQPGVRIVGSGRAIEIFKEVGLPKHVYE